jgi:7,8-dihydroneopterin aldolase/epimerase/oxygenase
MSGATDARPSDAVRDRLTLAGVVCHCHIGVTEEERRQLQKLEVDLDLFADLEAAGRSGDLAQTVDYRQVCDAVRGLLEATRFHLIEAAALAIGDGVLKRFTPVSRAVVRVRKFVLKDVAHVEVEMERRR